MNAEPAKEMAGKDKQTDDGEDFDEARERMEFEAEARRESRESRESHIRETRGWIEM